MDSDKKIRVAAYIRVSTEEQAKEGYGLETQLRHIKNAIESHQDKGWELPESLIYRDEGYSGALMNRPGLNKMLEDAKKGKFQVLVVWKIDRLFRRTQSLLNVIEELGNANVDFKSVTEPFDTTAVGRFIFQMFGALAEFERNLIMTRTMEGRISSSKAGNYVGGGVPYGYDIEDQKLIENEEEGRIVRNIFMWFVDLDWSIQKIANTLTERKVLTKADKNKMKKRSVNPPAFWHNATVKDTLKNEKYIGRYYYNREGKDKNGKKYTKPKSEWVEFSCLPLVDENRFQKAQIKLKTQKTGSNNSKNKYLFSGKIICGGCNSFYTGCISTKKTKNYRCGKNNPTKVAETCKARQISELILDDMIWPQIKALMEYPKAELKKMQKKLRANSYYQTLINDKKHLKKQIEANQEARKRMKAAFKRGIYTLDEFEEEMKAIELEYEQNKEQMEAINAQLTVEQSQEEKILSLQEMKERQKKNLEQFEYEDKRKLYKVLIERIIIKGADIVLRLKVPKSIEKQINKSGNVCGVTTWN